MMKILFTLCGRAGSKGFKNKNLKYFLKAPLAYYSVAAMDLYIRRHPEHEVYAVLSTDSPELMDLIEKQTSIKFYVLNRAEDLCGDSVSKVAVIRDCLVKAKEYFSTDFDVVLDLDITSPLRTVQDIANALEKKSQRKDTDVVYSVTTSRRSPYFNMVKEENGYFKRAVQAQYTARQQAPTLYDMNASIYAYAPQALMDKPIPVFFLDGADAIFMKDTAVLDIDGEEDFELIQVIGKYFYEKYPDFQEVYIRAVELAQGK